jgi:integrase
MAILFKKEVLEGKASVIELSKSPGRYYLRVLVPGTRKYQSKLIPGADSPEAAEAGALDVLLQLKDKPVLKITTPEGKKVVNRRGRVRELERCVYEYIHKQEQKVYSEQLDWKTVDGKKQSYKQLLAYLEWKKVTHTNQIDVETFEDYPVWRRTKDDKAVKKGTLATELGHFCDFLSNHLGKHHLLDRDLDPRRLTPHIPNINTEANPPLIQRGNWLKVHTELRAYKKRAEHMTNHRGLYFAKLFYRFVMIARNCGLRPDCELMKLRWSDVQRENVGRWSKTKEKTVDKWITLITVVKGKVKRNGKTSRRTVPCNGVDSQLREWKKEQQEYIDKYVNPRASKPVVITDDTLIFGNPYREMRQYDYSRFGNLWRALRKHMNLTPYKLAPLEEYTLYSLRSTYICNLILQDKSIYVVAKLAGHTVGVSERYYLQIDMMNMSKQITDFEYGQRGRRTSITGTY